MSNTSKQIGSPEGGYCCDPTAFSNSKARGNFDDMAEVDSMRRGATDPQFTQTGANAEFTHKTSAPPRVGDMPGVHAVRVRPQSNIENYGK